MLELLTLLLELVVLNSVLDVDKLLADDKLDENLIVLLDDELENSLNEQVNTMSVPMIWVLSQSTDP